MMDEILHNGVQFNEDMLVFYNNNRFNMYNMPEMNWGDQIKFWNKYDEDMKNLYGQSIFTGDGGLDKITDCKNEMLDDLNTFFQNLYEMMDNSDDDFSVVEGEKEVIGMKPT